MLTITGAATNPVVTYKKANGTTVGTMTFTVSLGSGATLTIDFGLQTITSSTTANAVPLWTGFASGESFIRIDPRHGDFGSSSWPTLRVSSGTGEYVYKRRWAA